MSVFFYDGGKGWIEGAAGAAEMRKPRCKILHAYCSSRPTKYVPWLHCAPPSCPSVRPEDHSESYETVACVTTWEPAVSSKATRVVHVRKDQ
jgi:hypothetical protein